jgi:glyoxylase-like metal-dependent hydrolase (beta-lactamase superfamily II)
MNRRITVDILGDAPLFSVQGKGFAYRVSCGGSAYLVDCGANIFNALTADELFALDGIFITHVHSDHVRYLADLAFYLQFSAKRPKSVRLIASERVHAQLRESLAGAMDLTLNKDRRSIRQMRYDEFFDCVLVGPEPLYVIEPPSPHRLFSVPTVRRTSGGYVPPHKAKVCIHPYTERQSILFYDNKTKCWVDPECFYDFSSTAYYEKDQRDYHDESAGLRVSAVKKGVWHGMNATGYLFQRGETRVLFTGDTVADYDLWRRLATEKIGLQGMKSERFLKSRLIGDDPVNFIERVWSPDRIEGLDELYGNTATFHECGGGEQVVHTDYMQLEKFWRQAVGDKAAGSSLALVHTPARLVSRFPIAMPGQRYVVEGGRFVNPERADYYIKEENSLRLANEDARGKHCIYPANVHGFEQLVCGRWRKSCKGDCVRVRLS